MLKIGIIGAGKMGRVHATKYKAHPIVELVGVYDANPQAAQNFASTFQIPVAEAPQDLINQSSALSICTPTMTHLDYIELAAKAGKAIMVEKPLGRTLEQCEQAVKAVRTHKVVCMVGHVVRYFKEYRTAHDHITNKVVGDPAVVRTRRGGWNNVAGTWFSDIDKSGGIILDLIIHDFDWLRWTFGDVDAVFAQSAAAKSSGKYCDYALAVIKFKSGVIAHVEGSWIDMHGWKTGFEVACDNGLLSFDSVRDTSMSIAKMPIEGVLSQPVNTYDLEETEDPYYREISHFVDCVINNKEPDIPIEDGYEATRIALATLHSAQTGKPVVLSEGGYHER